MHQMKHLVAALIVTCSANLAFADSAPPTFANNVAKIIHAKCMVCHRPDSSGPFPLITYEDVRKRAATIEGVLEVNYMPPWKPVDHGIVFANARSLSEQEERTIKKWIDAGCPEGDRKQTPAPPRFMDGWTLGKPDMVVTMNGEFQVPADGPDIYRSFVFPLGLTEDKWVKAVELRPRARSAVHHAIFLLDPTGNARKMDGLDGKAGIAGMGFLATIGEQAVGNPAPGIFRRTKPGFGWFNRLRRPDAGASSEQDNEYPANQPLTRGLGGYVPGSIPNKLPGDLAMALPRGSDIVMQTHFHPSGKPETEKAELALYFADQPPSQPLVPIMVPPMFGFGANIKIPPGEKNFRIADSFTLPVDVRAIGVSGHAHYICREMQLTAVLPTGETRVLLHIDDWDLDWQDQYLFAEPIDLPAGTALRTELRYDNSAENPENPHHPPRMVRWGRGSTDEMGSMTLQTIAKQADQGPGLRTAVRQYFMASFVNRKGSDVVDMLMQLDDNHDGKLQRSEAPPRMNAQTFRLADADQDGALDRTELTHLLKLRDLLRAGGQ